MKPCYPFRLLTFMTFLSGIMGASLTTSPTQITVGGSSPTSQVTVSCRPDAPGITQVYNIEIGRKSSTGSNQPIIQMGITDSSVTVVDTSLQQRMTVSGSIQFILTDLRCTDAASTYYCTTLYLAGSNGSDEATANITARTYPENVEMFPSPDRVSYDEGQLISFRCNGRIGNQFDVNNLQNLWTWEYRSIDSEFTSWTRYPNDQSITYDPPTPVFEGCQYNGASTLVHTVSTLDNWRQFRCSVISADYSANKAIYVVGQSPPGQLLPNGHLPPGQAQSSAQTAPGQPPPSGQQTPGQTSSSEASTSAICIQNSQESSLGVGVAIGVCVMLVVDAICLGLAFLFRGEIANCISGAKESSNKERPVLSNIQTPASVISPVEIQTQGEEYEIPVDRNHYDALQSRTADISNTYEKIRTYQNV